MGMGTKDRSRVSAAEREKKYFPPDLIIRCCVLERLYSLRSVFLVDSLTALPVVSSRATYRSHASESRRARPVKRTLRRTRAGEMGVCV